MPNNYFPELKSKAVFPSDEPKPQFKALVVGLEAGGQIPIYAGEAAIYHFLEGEGLMTPLRMKPLTSSLALRSSLPAVRSAA